MTAATPGPPVVVGVDGTAATLLAVEWAANYCGGNAHPLRLVAAYREDFFEAELRAAGGSDHGSDSETLHAAQRHLDAAAIVAR